PTDPELSESSHRRNPASFPLHLLPLRAGDCARRVPLGKRREPPFGGSPAQGLGFAARSQLVHSGSGLPTKQSATDRHERESEEAERARVVGLGARRRQVLHAEDTRGGGTARRSRGARSGGPGGSGRSAGARARGSA